MEGDAKAEKFNKEDTLYCLGRDFSNPYSVTDGGVNPYQSWNAEGQAEYERLLGVAKTGRETENSKVLEKWCLDELRRKNRLTADSKDQERKKKRRKMTPTVHETAEQLEQMWDD